MHSPPGPPTSPFTTQFLLHPDIAKAADEAIANIERMRVAGFARQAFDLASALIAQGPWGCPTSGLNYQRIVERLPLLAWLSGQGCPAVGGHRSRSPAQLDALAREEQQLAFVHVLMADRLQLAPAGEQWSRAWLEDLVDMPTTQAASGLRAGFIADLLWVLKARARAALRNHMAESIPPVSAGLTPLRTSAPIVISPNADRFSHDDLLRIVESCVDEHSSRAVDVAHCELLAALLDLVEGNETRAVTRLTRTPWHVEHLPCNDAPIRRWPPYVDLQRRRAFASALQVNDFTVARYHAEFFRRSPERLEPVVTAERDWPGYLAEYSRRRARALADPETARATAEIAEFHLPFSPALVERAQRLQFTAPGAGEERIAALEARLGQGLPPSYRHFLSATDGLFGGFVMLLPVEQVDWLSNLEPDLIEIWADVGGEATDAQYARYGPDQDCIFMRSRHLRRALQISTSIDGDVLLLIPDVRFGDEWEAWFLGAKNPGAYRYRSFADLFDELLCASADANY